MLIQRDKEWKVHVLDHLVSTDNEILAQYDPTMTSEIILPLIYTLNDASLCLERLTFGLLNWLITEMKAFCHNKANSL